MKKLTRKNLDELAKMMPVISEIEQRRFVGGGNGSYECPYTVEEYDRMCANGTWYGGYVQGWGYTYPDAIIFNGSGHYYTFGDYIQSLSNSGVNQLAGWGSGFIDFGLSAYLTQENGDANRDIQYELLNLGYDKNGLFYVDKVYYTSTYEIRVYDARTGNLITKRTVNNLTGSWY